MRDKLYSLEDVISMLIEVSEKRAKSASVRARKTLGRKKRPTKPILVADDVEEKLQSRSSRFDDELSSSDIETLERSIEQFDCYRSDLQKLEDVKVQAEVNDVRVIAVTDTGAVLSKSGTVPAETGKVRQIDKGVSLKSMSKRVANKRMPFKVQIGESIIKAPLYVVQDTEFPLIIGTYGFDVFPFETKKTMSEISLGDGYRNKKFVWQRITRKREVQCDKRLVVEKLSGR